MTSQKTPLVRSILWSSLVVGCVAIARRALSSKQRARALLHRNVIVTGGSRGLGLLIAEELLRHGAHVVIAARDGAELERAAMRLRAIGQVTVVCCDLTLPEDVERLVAEARSSMGRIDALVHDAGIITVGPMEDMQLGDYEAAMATHFWAPLRLMNLVIPEMKARREGRIVNISSIGGVISAPHLLPYSASKFALRGLSEGMAAALSEYGIRVTTVLPGLMRTGSPRHGLFKGNSRREHAWFTLANSLPGISMDARRAARRIVLAMAKGESELILTTPARLAAIAHGLAPALVLRALAWVNRWLPAPVPGGLGSQARSGSDSESRWSSSWLTRLTAKAAQRNNEL